MCVCVCVCVGMHSTCLHVCVCVYMRVPVDQRSLSEEYLTTEGQHHDYSQVEGTGKGGKEEGRQGEREGREMREINT